MATTMIWTVKMADNVNRRAVMNTYNVRAKSLREAVDKAEKLEKAFTAEMTESEGETFTPAEPMSVDFVCELDD